MATRQINRTERLTDIERMLREQVAGLRAVEIAEACGVDRRTIYRDISLLNDIGVPIYQKDGRFYLDREHYAAGVRLNLNEMFAVFIAARALLSRDISQNPHIVSTLHKLSRLLPESIGLHVTHLVSTMRHNPVDRAFVTVLETLTRAWAEQLKVRVWHKGMAAHEFATYFIEPGRNSRLYAIGYDYSIQRLSALPLQQITRVQLLQSHYKIPAELDRRHWMRRMQGEASAAEGQASEVVLAFAADVVPVVRQSMERMGRHMALLEDHRALVSIWVKDWRDILPWIRSWGGSVEVLRPPALREHMAADAARLTAVYQSKA